MENISLNPEERHEYKVGGSLSPTAPCYVQRNADSELLEALQKGDFCYVLNCRQMGKSSLKARTIQLLESRGFACAAVDVTKLGTKQVTADRWYKGLVVELARVFNLSKTFDLKAWRSELADLSALQQRSLFLEDILLTKISSKKICIFLEEIDNVKSLDFSTDDLFALIRSCYEQRLSNSAYQRLTFCLLGVAAPSDLISDKQRTPFNIGRSIDLHGFSFVEAQPALTPGLAAKVINPDQTLAEILDWTGGQPFLTQKLCNLAAKNAINNRVDIHHIVHEEIIDNWEMRDTPPHLKTIRDRLKANSQKQVRLLSIYQRILLNGEIDADDTTEQVELQLSGLVVRDRAKLRIYNRLYQFIFDQQWVERELIYLRPDFYSVALAGWLIANRQEDSWLLRGEVLKKAQKWAADKSLSDDDYRFLDASRQLEQQETQRRLDIEAESAKILAAANQVLVDANDTLAEANNKAKRQIQIGGGILVCSFAVAFFASIWAGMIAGEARLERINSLTLTATAALNANREIEALLASIKAAKELKSFNSWLTTVDDRTQQSVRSILQRSFTQIHEQNRLEGHIGKIRRIRFSPDGKALASIAEDGTLILWNRSGEKIKKIEFKQQLLRSVTFSPDSQAMAVIDARNNITLLDRHGQEKLQVNGQEKEDTFISDTCFIDRGRKFIAPFNQNEIVIRDLQGKILTTLRGHKTNVWSIRCNEKSKLILTGDRSGVVKIWNWQGQEIKSIDASIQSVFDLAWSPDGKTIAVASGDRTVKLWNVDGQEINKLVGHTNNPTSVEFSPDGQFVVSSSFDRTTRIWSAITGQELTALKGHDDEVLTLNLSPDGQTLATGGGDKKIRLWNLVPRSHQVAIGHRTSLWAVDFHPHDSQIIATAGDDKVINIWNQNGQKISSINAPSRSEWNRIWSVKFSPNGQIIATANYDRTIGLWNNQGQKLHTLSGHQEAVVEIDFSPNGQMLASASYDGTIHLWAIDGKLLYKINTNGGKVFSLAFSPDGQRLVSGHENGNIKIWDLTGKLLADRQIHRLAVTSVSFSPNGQIVAAGSSDHTISLWNLSQEKLLTLTGHTAGVTKISFHPNGHIIASSSADHTLRLWQVQDGQEIKVLQGQGYPFWNLSFSPDGKILASVSENGLMQLWDTNVLSLDTLTRQSCQWLRDYLATRNDRVCLH